MNKLILSDGTELTNFTLNGTMLEFDSTVDKSVFEGKLKNVQVVTDEQALVYQNAYLITWDNQPNWIAFAEKSELELLQEKLLAKVDYLAMMTDTEMEV